MDEVKLKNGVLRRRESERQAVRAHCGEAQRAFDSEQQGYVDAVVNNLRRAVSANGLAVIARRCELRRARLEELQNLLRAAEAAVAAARTTAAHARRAYMRAHARHEALLILAKKWQLERADRDGRAAEQAAQDLQANALAEVSLR
ncbi:MAG TPA: hypothetical protein VGI32_10605 [Steroidobacteraceae bacterium]|jgi:hypothetical protein